MEFDQLPNIYDRKLWDEKVERTYQFIFEHYGDEAHYNNRDIVAVAGSVGQLLAVWEDISEMPL